MIYQNKSTHSTCSVLHSDKLKWFLGPMLKVLNRSKAAISFTNTELCRPINYLSQEYYILLSTQDDRYGLRYMTQKDNFC